MRRATRSHLRSLFISTSISSCFVSQVYASSQFSFFEHSSCNAGTAFYQLTNPNPLTSDLNCHQMPNGAVAIYISEIDNGCTLRTYSSSTCDPSTLSGLLLLAGTCFYDAKADAIGSWRADCAGIDYTDSNGEDQGNSYSAGAGNDTAIVGILATATGPVTVSPTHSQVTKTVVPLEMTSSAATSSSTGGADSMGSAATMSAATTTMSSLANAGTKQRGIEATAPFGLMLVLAAFLG